MAQVNFSILTGSGFSLYYSCVQFAQVRFPVLTVPGLVRFSFREMRQLICCSNRLGMWRVFLRAWNFSKSFAVLTASTMRLFCVWENWPSSFAVLVGSLFGCFRLRIWPGSFAILTVPGLCRYCCCVQIAQVQFAILTVSRLARSSFEKCAKYFCCFNWLGFWVVFLRVRESAKYFAVLTVSGFGLDLRVKTAKSFRCINWLGFLAVWACKFDQVIC